LVALWINGLLAQLVEQVTLNHRVVGSIPTQPTPIHALKGNLPQKSLEDCRTVSSKLAVTKQTLKIYER
jgi:hypothetical protein